MDREFTFSKDKLRLILAGILEDDIRGGAAYRAEDRAEEGFEKRAVLEFLLWFVEEAFPDEFTFPCTYEGLESDYPEACARRIADGRGWAAKILASRSKDEKVVFVDFNRNKP